MVRNHNKRNTWNVVTENGFVVERFRSKLTAIKWIPYLSTKYPGETLKVVKNEKR